MDNVDQWSPDVKLELSSGHHLFLSSGQYRGGMVDEYPSRLLDRIVIRVPDGMRDRVATAAKMRNRSVNAELVSLLEERYPAEPSLEEAIKAVQDVVDLVNRLRIPEFRDPMMKALSEIDKAFQQIQPRLLERSVEGTTRPPKRKRKPQSA